MSTSGLPQFAGSSQPFIGGTYRAFGVRAVDGDTIDVIVDCGFEQYRTERVRLYGVNTPEMHAVDPAARAQAQAAKTFVAGLIEGKVFVVHTSKATDTYDKYGRYLADVAFADGSNLAVLLIANGLGVAYFG